MNTYKFPFAPYDSRRYEPWGARVSFKNNWPQYDFCGHWNGNAIVINAKAGDVLAFGQKDYVRNNSSRRFFIAQLSDGALVEVTEAQARTHWKETQAASSRP